MLYMLNAASPQLEATEGLAIAVTAAAHPNPPPPEWAQAGAGPGFCANDTRATVVVLSEPVEI